jgi:hypothetical protein
MYTTQGLVVKLCLGAPSKYAIALKLDYYLGCLERHHPIAKLGSVQYQMLQRSFSPII